MSRRLDLLLTGASGWLRSSVVGSGTTKNQDLANEERVMRVPEAETRATEIQAILRRIYPAIHWTVTFELQQRSLVAGPLEQYVIVKGLRRDGRSMPVVRIFWRDAASTTSARLVRQIEKGLRLGS